VIFGGIKYCLHVVKSEKMPHKYLSSFMQHLKDEFYHRLETQQQTTPYHSVNPVRTATHLILMCLQVRHRLHAQRQDHEGRWRDVVQHAQGASGEYGGFHFAPTYAARAGICARIKCALFTTHSHQVCTAHNTFSQPRSINAAMT